MGLYSSLAAKSLFDPVSFYFVFSGRLKNTIIYADKREKKSSLDKSVMLLTETQIPLCMLAS